MDKRSGYNWGRARRGSAAISRSRLAAGGVLCALFLAALASRGGGEDAFRREETAAASAASENRYVAVMLGVDDLPRDGISAAETGEPPGYIGGRWNLWEFIGDSISSLFTKK